VNWESIPIPYTLLYGISGYNTVYNATLSLLIRYTPTPTHLKLKLISITVKLISTTVFVAIAGNGPRVELNTRVLHVTCNFIFNAAFDPLGLKPLLGSWSLNP